MRGRLLWLLVSGHRRTLVDYLTSHRAVLSASLSLAFRLNYLKREQTMLAVNMVTLLYRSLPKVVTCCNLNAVDGVRVHHHAAASHLLVLKAYARQEAIFAGSWRAGMHQAAPCTKKQPEVSSARCCMCAAHAAAAKCRSEMGDERVETCRKASELLHLLSLEVPLAPQGDGQLLSFFKLHHPVSQRGTAIR